MRVVCPRSTLSRVDLHSQLTARRPAAQARPAFLLVRAVSVTGQEAAARLARRDEKRGIVLGASRHVTVLLLHPVALDRNFWQLTRLDGVRLEYPGHGDRMDEAGLLHSLDALAAEIVSSHEGPLDLVGVSMGGVVAQHVAVRFPHRVRSALLACCGPGRNPTMPATSDIRAEDTLRLGMDGTLDATLRRWFSPRALARRDHPGVAYARRRLLADDPVVVSKTWSILGTHSLREELLGIAAPVTVLGGRDDAAVPIGRLLELYEFLPKARLEVLPGPHMLPLEEPGAFANAVMRHLTWASLRTG